MMDASLPADQSGLSDLSAASIEDIEPHLAPQSPSDGFDAAPATPMQNSPPALIPMHLNATPGPSRLRTELNDNSRAAWTPSPEAEASRSKSSSRSIHRASPRSSGRGNESMGSSLGTFDFSNASFSESFLRQAGAHMLAGLDEAPLPSAPSSASSPRYRHSSSPTVTAKPIRPVDPRTPFTGKSLRTRMAEAGMLDSPASSDGSSPASSPTARVLPDSYTRTLTVHHEEDEGDSSQLPLDSPHDDHVSSSNSPVVDKLESDVSPLNHDKLTVMDSFGLSEHHEWQEGLSIVPEESYIEDASQLPSSPFGRRISHTSADLDEASRHSISELPPTTDAPEFFPSKASLSDAAENGAELSAGVSSPKRLKQGDRSAYSPDEPARDLETQAGDRINYPVRARAASPAATPPSAPRAPNTPRSFARLRVGTPVRSSPLSRVVNFSPSSAGSTPSQWQSPASQRSVAEAIGSSSGPSAGGSNVASPMNHIQLEAGDHQLFPQTPGSTKSAQQVTSTPSQQWSPATSASFATPASQRPLPQSTPVTPANFRAAVDHHASTSASAFASPAAEFGTPQWTPSPGPSSAESHQPETVDEAAQPDISIKTSLEVEEEESASSSACSSASAASERKQSGDVSTASQPESKASPRSGKKSHKLDTSLASTKDSDSPSVARFSRMQLSRASPPIILLNELESVPELGIVAKAFDSLSHLSDSRVSRLLAQLSAATAKIEELENALDAKEGEAVELQDVRVTLSQLSMQYEELVAETDAKDVAVAEMVKQLQVELKEGGRGRERELGRQLEEERRLREVDRRDYEVRIQGLLNPANSSSVPSDYAVDQAASTGDAKLSTAVEQAKEQLRLTLEKDFDIRRAMEQRELLAKVERLERELASAPSPTDVDGYAEQQRQIDQLTTDLDRRFEELEDLRSELDAVASARDSAEERVAMLEEELESARISQRGNSHSHDSKSEDELVEELEALQTALAERDAQISNLEETLSLTTSRLTTVTTERDALSHQNTVLSQTSTDSAERIQRLESHILTLESELRVRTPSSKSTSTNTESASPERLLRLERELSNLQLELVKATKANEALQEDNVNFSIALSAKQLELGMVKRNARFALKDAANANVGVEKSVGLPRSKAVAVVFPTVPKGEVQERKGGRAGYKENVVPRREEVVNTARAHARQMLEQRRGTGVGGGEGRVEGGYAARRRQMIAA
ncbi:hypothetical protein PHSY_006299 [Pseudozyma hubeiensis SY62]|uniref:Uncharacterized protein n=1 Tax=Pseudozyma hubeiensis (strain SY62) TaxID=1305764 RepID=R9PKR1_PSEHS|nr:hypothetical protein PHSY_006299 [Pseudozyma hubeiensis SY62]GAC98705.1 hypothetical protein PHSY_006299 [Pseudozyma hubeiensis SY62]